MTNLKPNLKFYELFSEWRSRGLYGESLTDALTRAKKLQRPDKYAQGSKVEEGEWIEIKQIASLPDVSNGTRGGRVYICAIIETQDGQYLEVDAIEHDNLKPYRGDKTK